MNTVGFIVGGIAIKIRLIRLTVFVIVIVPSLRRLCETVSRLSSYAIGVLLIVISSLSTTCVVVAATSGTSP